MSDIIILGCGLSGMITALSLAKHNIPSTIIEAKNASDSSFFDDIRTTALNAGSVDYFQKIDVWDVLSPECGPINDIYVADNKAEEMLHFSKEFTPHNQVMGYLIENNIFKKCLYDLVAANKSITVLEGTGYKDIVNNEDGCEISVSDHPSLREASATTRHCEERSDVAISSLMGSPRQAFGLPRDDDHSTLTCKLLIACDGRNSKAKNLFFSNEIEQDYKQTAITFIVHHQKKHGGTAVEHFMPSGPFAILPLKDEHRSSIVWTLPKDHAEVFMSLPLDEFTYMVQENFGQFLGKIQISSKIAAFPLKAHATRKYYNKSIVLVADTAHIIHPLAGQGLNQGIKDIECLVGLLGKEEHRHCEEEDRSLSETKGPVLKLQALGTSSPHLSAMPRAFSTGSLARWQIDGYSNLLSNYQKLRQADNENMLLITDSINGVFGSKSGIFHSARQLGFKAIETIPTFKKLLIKYAMGKRGS